MSTAQEKQQFEIENKNRDAHLNVIQLRQNKIMKYKTMQKTQEKEKADKRLKDTYKKYDETLDKMLNADKHLGQPRL